MRAITQADFQILNHWCSLRDLPPLDQDVLPDTGFIVDEIAAGFLIAMNNNMGILDFYVSNPHSDKKERDVALDEITKELIATAKDVGMKRLICTTKNDAISKRAMFHGFEYMGQFASFRLEL